MEKRSLVSMNTAVDSIYPQRNEVPLPCQMNGGSLTIKTLRGNLNNLILRKCLQIEVIITSMILTLLKSSVFVLQSCLLTMHSFCYLL